MNLITRFLRIERNRLKQEGYKGLNSDVIFFLNKELGTRYQQGRVKEWERGERRPSVETHNHILKRVLTYELKKNGLAEDVIGDIIQKTQLPEAMKK
ncbi:hypothetical protein [sulfur-oxidizing endosymbiont of Gigantopelta aegis]|uniref:hypothetical protein n=1 Tax=sulfur-oxidizing endosymbiont of Gigantopelta aegis TaxID=2794934 RepID=UPI0018DB49C0|nr:hypothetical protein [sulfur-oxidizing endosymbiont of Gigantopelta aegis]